MKNHSNSIHYFFTTIYKTLFNRLKRSKRTLIEFDKEKKELERLRKVQQEARAERDQWFRRNQEARSHEEQIRGDMRILSEKMDECWKQVRCF